MVGAALRCCSRLAVRGAALRFSYARAPRRPQVDGYSYERSRKIDKISSADFAVARLSRTDRSFRNFAMEASVRRCVWNWLFGTMKSTTNFTGALSSASNSMPVDERPKDAI